MSTERECDYFQEKINRIEERLAHKAVTLATIDQRLTNMHTLFSPLLEKVESKASITYVDKQLELVAKDISAISASMKATVKYTRVLVVILAAITLLFFQEQVPNMIKLAQFLLGVL